MSKLKAQVSGIGKNKLLQAVVLDVLGNRIAVQLVSNGKKLIGIPFVGGPISVGKIVYVNYASGSPVAECRGESSEFTQSKPSTSRTVTTEFTPEQVGGATGTGSVAPHGPTHTSGGTDPIKLDDLAAPDDNTDLDATTSRHGLLPKLSGETTSFLRADGTWAQPTGVGTTNGDGAIQIGIDGGGVTPLIGHLLDFVVPFDVTITGWTIVANASGAIVIDLGKDTYANFPPTVADSVTGSDKPRLSNSDKATSSTLTGWTTSWQANDIIRVNIDSASLLTKAVLSISYTRS